MATTLMVVLFLAVCIAMILVVLIQRPQGGGLSGAFGAGGGGSGSGQTAFGTKTGDVLTYATIGVFILFVVLAVVLNFATRPPEPSDNTPTIVAPGTPRETTQDEGSETEGADVSDETDQGIDDAQEVINDAVDQVDDETTPTTDPSDD